MADLVIQGMKMPNDENGFVKLVIYNDGRCFVAVGENEVTSKTGIVTARELPAGHGRLIDADALLSVLDILKDKSCDGPVWEQMRDIVENMVTIVSAEGCPANV